VSGLQLILEALKGGYYITGGTTLPVAGLVWTEGLFYGFCNVAKFEALKKLETDT